MKKRIFLALTTLTAASLACSIFVGGPDYPTTTVPVSTTAVGNLQDQIQQAFLDGAKSGTVIFKISESQLTSYLTYEFDAQSDPIIRDPLVLLRDGQMVVYGKAQSGLFMANVQVTMQVSVDENGQPKIAISQSDFGPLPAPQGLNEAVSALLEEAFTGSLGPVATGFRLESITIADGMMTVTGRIK